MFSLLKSFEKIPWSDFGDIAFGRSYLQIFLLLELNKGFFGAIADCNEYVNFKKLFLWTEGVERN